MVTALAIVPLSLVRLVNLGLALSHNFFHGC
jgi:hypothetical protein